MKTCNLWDCEEGTGRRRAPFSPWEAKTKPTNDRRKGGTAQDRASGEVLQQVLIVTPSPSPPAQGTAAKNEQYI